MAELDCRGICRISGMLESGFSIGFIIVIRSKKFFQRFLLLREQLLMQEYTWY